uniref:Secreted protein n=1 Tax=Anopheles darlingi TaxID=43151 RepID=A0A2M4D9G0_ANODA
MAKELVAATGGVRLTLTLCGVLLGLIQLGPATTVAAAAATTTSNAVRVNKCCEKFEVVYDGKCTVAETVNASK